MIIAYGILIPAIFMFILGMIITPFYNRDVEEGIYIPKTYYTKSDEIELTILYLLILCCSQYIWG